MPIVPGEVMRKRPAETAEIATSSLLLSNRFVAHGRGRNLRCLVAAACRCFRSLCEDEKLSLHMTGNHFRDYHLLLDEHADQILAMTDAMAERARKAGGLSLRSISDVARHQRIKDNSDEGIPPRKMLQELWADIRQLMRFLRATHEVWARHDDVVTAGLMESWMDQTKCGTWFLSEIVNDL